MQSALPLRHILFALAVAGIWLCPGLASAQAPVAGLSLPASFVGIVPCADCAGIAQTLTLREDGLYRMRRTYLGRPGNPVSEVGHWRADVDGRLLLRRGSELSLFAIDNADTLRQLDRAGQPIRSALNYSLRRTARVDAVDESLRWRGEMIYMADAATLTDCASGVRWPVAMTADYLTLERAYSQARKAPGEPVLVAFDGRLAVMPGMEGAPREHMVVEAFAAAEPLMALEAAFLQALTRSTGYRIDGEELTLLDGEQVLARFAAVYLR